MQRFFLLIVLAGGILISCERTTQADKPAPGMSVIEPEYIHSSFGFTEADFQSELSGLPSGAAESPERFLNLALDMLAEEDWILLLVDKEHSLSKDFAPPFLVSLKDFPAINPNRHGMELSRRGAEELADLSRAAAEDGVLLTVSSAYRSWEYQNNLFETYAARDGVEAASRYSARPGESQHQLGTVVDFGSITNDFASTDAGLWIQENGLRFGWSLSYPEGAESETGYMWESWHWRFIGIPAAEMQLEFFDGSQQALLEFWNENREILEKARI